MKCSMKLLSPLHVGNGNELKMVDFHLNKRKGIIKFINFEKFIEHCIKENIDLKEEMQNRRYYTGRDFSITRFMNVNNIDPNAFTSYAVDAKIETRSRESEFAIKEFVKCGGPYLPGSSIKGAIRTALLWKSLTERPDGVEIVQNGLKPWLKKHRISGRDLKSLDDNISKIVFGKDTHSDILRVMRPSDTIIAGKNHLEVSEIKIVGNSQEIPVYVENLKAGSELFFDLVFDEYLLNQNKGKPDFKNHPCAKYMNVQAICKACNEFSKNVLEKHLEYMWENYNCDSTIDEFDMLWNEVLKCEENEAILHIGWGGGWYSTTIGLILDSFPNFTSSLEKSSNHRKHTENSIREHLQLGRKPGTNKYSSNFPKTRRLTIEGKPLGWVKLSFKHLDSSFEQVN
ncbi:CRISPR-associated protein, Csm5 family [Methanosarcina sp. MTP4]|uniref:type III-A CRISPR-associated RAMP protein Csm5 n=1 Tax=Methanosarcina sp. MTP4 TaxID=1434100 RepID=UPI0006161242|nr:type III-A CRISPR-associated RAMP protein Csm5 [Methanosarcina sp. MTP4]AKB26312.1 CRISPR-associated protein, Csm5 family [Methanosarcina sp. MTP4]